MHTDLRLHFQSHNLSCLEHGELPTNWQRFWLVTTRLYNSKGDIPVYVSSRTMNRMHDRMRILFISLGLTTFFTLFFYYEHKANKIARNPLAGYPDKGSPQFPSWLDVTGSGDDENDELNSYMNQISQFNTTFGCYSMIYF
ncbi:hypothetical protein OESDEN_00658 [Oesophagostomum dentatum]|uniref:Uncharacterized protein n=1 Tax=Oesophagostomum dentatum TaxID=61180 RepID=A0A0B1TT84_OESDE|nr:hypothetical protein OESDEN_00658 [Oesophagostomum dentatum]